MDVNKTKDLHACSRKVASVVEHRVRLSWWEVPDAVLEWLHGTGFENLAELINFEASNPLSSLATALVQLYDVDKRCFVFNGLELFFGLEDVLKIFGLPIDGKPVIRNDGSDEEFVEKYLGVTIEDGIELMTGGIRPITLKTKFQNSDYPSIQYIRAYVLYIIGCLIAPGDYTVPGHYLALLEDVDKIKDYAWGAAMLTNLHRGLESAKKSSTPSLGHSLFLMIFILEHIPKVVRKLNIDTSKVPSASFPLVLRWFDQLTELSENHSSVPSDSQLLALFSQLTHDEIIWSPYNGLSVPAPYNEQVPMGCSLTSILCMENSVLHDPTLRADVDRPSERISLYREKLLCVHRLSRTKEMKNWCEIHVEFLKHWDQRKDYLVNLIDAEEYVSQQQNFEGQEKDESPSKEAEREILPAGSPEILANDMPEPTINITKHSPAIHGSSKKPFTDVMLDDTTSSTPPLSSDEDALPLSSLRKIRKRSEASVGGDSSCDDSKIDEVEQFFAHLPTQIEQARSPGIDVKSPTFKKPRHSAQVLNRTKAEVQKLLMMPLHEVVLPVNFSALMAALPIYAALPHLSAEKIDALKELKENLQSLFFDFHTAKKQQEECNSKACQKVILIDELTKGQELYNDVKHRLNKLDTSMNSIRSQISELNVSLEEAKMKRRDIQEEGLNLKNTYSAKLASLAELEAEFLDLRKELADSQISQAEVSWQDYKQKLVGLGL